MEEMVAAIEKLFAGFFNIIPNRIEKLPQSGSDRIYFRLYVQDTTYIATYNLNIRENETFIYFAEHFIRAGLPMPEVICVSPDKKIYIQQDLGTESLLDKVEQDGLNENTFELYRQTLQQLARVQILGDKDLDYGQCLTAKEFGKQAIMNDLLYFKYYFLDTLKLPYDKQAMLNDFEILSQYLSQATYKYFLFRDFQSRNVIVKNGAVFFIDFQGGMKGALQYDVASLLWQAKANLPQDWKERLLNMYIEQVELLLCQKIDKPDFISQYNGYVLIRLLQVLGAYGFRGLFERKAHFLSSIPLALKNLQFFLQHHTVDVFTPEFHKVLQVVSSEAVVQQFETTKATADTPLVVKICSFSYKAGVPEDDSENGGGFVFDMRGILNPGRFEPYKYLTGRDKEVKDFLEQRTKMVEYLNNVFNLVDISVEDYIKRGFDSLMISFGCTGGQHRSVYAADALARHLRNKFGVKIALSHKVQDAKNWVNVPVSNLS